MKWLTVGIVAVAALTGCGVGADEGLLVADSQQLQGEAQQGQAPVAVAQQAEKAQAATTAATDGTVALPQDPVPIHPATQMPVEEGTQTPSVIILPAPGAPDFVVLVPVQPPKTPTY